MAGRDRVARRLSRIRDAAGELLDEAIVVAHRAPASFTGEDTVEVTSHGGPILPASILAAFVAAGARPAEPGEFTRRAVLNGKLDLLQAEAVGDLVDAQTRQAQRVALRQLDGGLSRRIADAARAHPAARGAGRLRHRLSRRGRRSRCSRANHGGGWRRDRRDRSAARHRADRGARAGRSAGRDRRRAQRWKVIAVQRAARGGGGPS